MNTALTHLLAKSQLQSQATTLGFSLFGVAACVEPQRFEHLRTWLDAGYAGSMKYIEDRYDAYRHPQSILDGCRSVIMLGIPYPKHPLTHPSKSDVLSDDARDTSRRSQATIGAYASGKVDYHDWIRDRLNQLSDSLRGMMPSALVRGVVDTAPLLERDFANLAGIGWIGKNTLLLNRTEGSYFFLAALLTDVELPSDAPFEQDHCGTCRACLDVCPTQAFVGPRILDASRCISYLTIEHRGSINPSLRSSMGSWLFGCDACQIVCPWNRKRIDIVDPEFEFHELDRKTDCGHWLGLDEASFRKLYRKTPFWRTRLVGMQRNAMIVAANTERNDLIETIQRFLSSHDATLSETARWALGQLQSSLDSESVAPAVQRLEG